MSLPTHFRKLVVENLSTRFRQCTAVKTVAMSSVTNSIKPTEILVWNKFAGVNASDINFTAGTYKNGVAPPFDCGFEAIGTVVAVGSNVKGFKEGDCVVTQAFGGFAEYQVVPTRNAKIVPKAAKEYLPLDLSATTASIALAEVAQPKAGEVALVTAAAGGTGQFAVQLLKHRYKCKVVGSCSSEEKRLLLQQLGCDVVINYKTEDMAQVIRQHFPTGVNLVYESVGGKMMDLALAHLALKGRIVTIGSISGYQDLSSWREPDGGARVPIPSQLLMKSASLRGFFLPHFQKFAQSHFQELIRMHDEEKSIRSVVDGRLFKGIESCADAVEYLHSGVNVGKVVVDLS